MHRRKTALVALLAMLVFGVACGDDDGGNAADTTSTTEAEKGSDTIQIDYVDYGYEVSGPLTAGGTIELANKGDEFHMIAAAKLKPGKTLEDLQEIVEQQFSGGGEGEEGGSDGPSTTSAEETSRGAQGDSSSTTGRSGATTSTTDDDKTSSTAAGGAGEGSEGEGGGEEEDPMAEVAEEVSLPGNFMSPGAEAAITLPDLEVGTYAIMCFIPTEGEGTPHIAKGMIDEFKVVEGDAPAEPTADATYKVEAGKAVQGPATLEAGETTLQIEGVGEAGDLEPTLIKLGAGETYASLDKEMTTLFESEDEAPPKGAAKNISSSIVFAGHDLADVQSFFLTVTLEAGNYVLVAEDSDQDDGPATPKEIIQIKVA